MRIALCGLGRAGRQVIRLVTAKDEHELCVVFCRDGSKHAGKKLLDIVPTTRLETPVYEVSAADDAFRVCKPDVLIDFSSKQATLQLLPACARAGIGIVVCTTNFTRADRRLMRDLAKSTQGFALAYAPNITLGVNVLMMLCEETARLVPEFDYAITEKHHNRKADISATAAKISAALEDIVDKPVPVNSIRAGGYVGLHEVLAVGEFERITIIHESFSRQAFANGAVIAAEFLKGREGYYEMRDVLADHFTSKKEASE